MTNDVNVVMLRRGEPRDSPSPVTIHGLRAWELVAEALNADGMTFSSTDPGGLRSLDLPSTVLLSDFGSIARLPASASAARAVISWSLESPLVAHRAFHRLDRIAESSAATLTFSGAKQVVKDPATITEVNYPITPRPPIEDRWEERGFAALIASSKHVRPSLSDVDLRRPYKSARVTAANLLARSYGLRRTWTVPDLYRERVKVIESMARQPGFALFGRGWDRSRVIDPDAVASCYRGPAGDKLETLAGFRFSICFENTRFPGYITEKIFDSFQAGAIPVYLGAPDIAEHIPPDTFVHAADHSDFDVLRRHLSGMTADAAAGYLAAARRFLSSPAFDPFDEATFVRTVIAAVRRAVHPTS